MKALEIQKEYWECSRKSILRVIPTRKSLERRLAHDLLVGDIASHRYFTAVNLAYGIHCRQEFERGAELLLKSMDLFLLKDWIGVNDVIGLLCQSLRMASRACPELFDAGQERMKRILQLNPKSELELNAFFGAAELYLLCVGFGEPENIRLILRKIIKQEKLCEKNGILLPTMAAERLAQLKESFDRSAKIARHSVRTSKSFDVSWRIVQSPRLRECANCTKLESSSMLLLHCGRGKSIWYCGKVCQRKHWKTVHKKECQPNVKLSDRPIKS